MFLENIKMAIKNILTNRMRSFLTSLGIIIGVLSIIALITIVSCMTGSITSQFNTLGAGKITVTIMGTPLKRGLNETDISQIAKTKNVAGITPNANITAQVVSDSNVKDDVAIQGKNEIYFEKSPKLILYGRAINALDMKSDLPVAVVNEDFVKTFFSGNSPIGKEIKIKGHSFTIIGVLDPNATADMASMLSNSSSSNEKVIIPYTKVLEMSQSNSVNSIDVYVTNTDLTSEVTAELENTLLQMFNWKDTAYNVLNIDSLLSTMNTIIGGMTTMLAGIASIALVVGGIGIMNMMLVSVSERTIEIGLRKALGARPSQIQTQFLIEAVILSLLGGIIGIILGVAISYLVVNLLNVPFILNLSAIYLGIGFSSLVGIIFGWMPSRRASKLNPIDALRSM